MRSSRPIKTPLDELASRLRDIELRHVESTQRQVRTGWREVDAVLPGGGLAASATHEWIGLNASRRGERWTPPLLVLAHLVRQAMADETISQPWAVWIGRRIWLYGHAAMHSVGHPSRCLWVDAPDAGERVWATDAALRCPGLVVIVDGSGFDAPSSRRLQLAAAGHGTLGLIARPESERGEISFAMTRWTVRTAPSPSLANRWVLELVRCKGLQAVDSHAWTIERNNNGWLGCVPAETADRSGTALAAS